MPEPNNLAIRVTLTLEQARTVVEALDVFMRIHMGQFNIIQEQFCHENFDRASVELLLLKARRLIYPELHGVGHSFGIAGCPSESARLGYDILQVIRQKESLARNPEGGMSVNFDSPYWVTDSEPRPKAEILNPLERLADI